ncbi:hypothetical protein [Parendozoicomonas sp. Alg238-R29]|uniref:hypothetical protein n=1 Tax=Parendozoicomonas sp. Alg238-R29 TaxID=2993446 RepID=UPI00248DD056|nr:hypothetical protein [Parendozoicomonas sp. Alg238-R29]
MKKLLSILAVVSTLATFSVHANTGIAFVHGTSNQTNAYDDYWTGSFINSVKQGLPNASNYTVINCDFQQYMWHPDAAGCLAGQLTSFIQQKNISSLIVVTHSNGGNVMRWIQSNPTSDSRYPNIINATSQIIALAPSSLGTPLADAATQGTVFEQLIGGFLGYGNDAVKMQQTGWMANYNAQYLYGTSGRPNLPNTFRSVVGSDVESAVWDSDSYCGGYSRQVGLEFTQNWLDNCSDGFLNCTSQAGAGSVWFYDKSRTKGKEPLSHNQSRRKCFNLDTILRAEVQNSL